MKSTRVVILAGGKGTRLRPFTASFPKPLVPLGDKPILEVVLRQLAAHGFRRATLTIGHLSDLIRAYVAQNRFIAERLEIDFVEETQPTGTAGSLARVEGLDDTFMVMNGDVLTNLDYSALVAAHKASGAALTIAAHAKVEKIELGVLEAGPDGRLTNYIEKPTQVWEVSMGIYVYEPRVLELIQPDTYLDFPDLVRMLVARGEHVHVYRNDAFWLDIGRPADYARAQEIIESEPARFGIAHEHVRH
ncbi:MAG: sugar phosphate nucleotidyltransferase [Hyphomicrobiaceae bacterium]